MYRQQLTPSQMEEASRKATADGMREVAEALNKKENKINKDNSDTDNSNSDTDSSSNVKKSHTSKSFIIQKKVSDNSAVIDKLEQQVHYLRLDLVNSKVEIDDARKEVIKLKSINDIYTKINNEFGFIRSAIERSQKNLDDLTVKQFKYKVALFIEEANEHVGLCERSINKIELHEIKFALERVLVAERKKIVKYTSDLNYKIWVKELYATLFNFSIILFVIIIIIIVMYNIKLI